MLLNSYLKSIFAAKQKTKLKCVLSFFKCLTSFYSGFNLSSSFLSFSFSSSQYKGIKIKTRNNRLIFWSKFARSKAPHNSEALKF